MAYFANGSEGEILLLQCESCKFGVNDGQGCPILAIQDEYNYSQVGKPEVEDIMNMLVNEFGVCQIALAFPEVVFEGDGDAIASMLKVRTQGGDPFAHKRKASGTK